jgi:death-on-curing protein
MYWLDASEVALLHQIALEESTSENPDADPPPALEEAVRRPHMYYNYRGVRDPHRLAAIYLVAIAKAHAFGDGNKRTALLAADTFLAENGIHFDMQYPSSDKVVAFLQGVAGHGARELGDANSPLSSNEATAWIEERSS